MNGAAFAASSVVTPFFFGAVAGRHRLGPGAGRRATGRRCELAQPDVDPGRRPGVTVCAYLAAVFLTADARLRAEPDLEDWARRRARGRGRVRGRWCRSSACSCCTVTRTGSTPSCPGRRWCSSSSRRLAGLAALARPAARPAAGGAGARGRWPWARCWPAGERRSTRTCSARTPRSRRPLRRTPTLAALTVVAVAARGAGRAVDRAAVRPAAARPAGVTRPAPA